MDNVVIHTFILYHLLGGHASGTLVPAGCYFYTLFQEDDTMAKAKKLPSGAWRCLVYDYTDRKGKRHYKSFTADTKREAEYSAAQYAAGKSDQIEECTLYEAIERYINLKENVLSPSTILGYRGMLKNYFKEIGTIPLKKLSNTDLQVWISDMAIKVSPKTCRNAHGLLAATLDMFAPDFRLKTTLPARIKPELYCPNDDDVKRLLEHIQGTELEIAVLLAAFGPLRRGEICALTSDDIHGNRITISKSMVLDTNRNWIIKQPKTYGSYREIELPETVIEKLHGKEGRLIQATPDQITNRFFRAIKYARLPHFRFHDLRHYSASIMHALGVPDVYIMQRGGWVSDYVMKSVYRNVINLEAAKQERKITKHFTNMQHKMQHGTEKTF